MPTVDDKILDLIGKLSEATNGLKRIAEALNSRLRAVEEELREISDKFKAVEDSFGKQAEELRRVSDDIRWRGVRPGRGPRGGPDSPDRGGPGPGRSRG